MLGHLLPVRGTTDKSCKAFSSFATHSNGEFNRRRSVNHTDDMSISMIRKMKDIMEKSGSGHTDSWCVNSQWKPGLAAPPPKRRTIANTTSNRGTPANISDTGPRM